MLSGPWSYLPRVPDNLFVEANPRLDVWELHQCGALVVGTTTELRAGSRGYLLASHTPNLWIDQTRVLVIWDEPMPGVGRPWFECPACGRRSRHLYLRDPIACRRCHRLRYSSQNMGQQTAGVGRIERLRRKLGDCDVRPFAPLPARRRGRSRACHDKLVALIFAEEAKLISHLGRVVHDLDRRIRVRKARGRW